jgi:hypothetical protein
MSFFKDIKENLVKSIEGGVDLGKAEMAQVVENKQDITKQDEIGSKAFFVDVSNKYDKTNHFYKQKYTRLSNKTLTNIARKDWVVSTIIQSREDNIMRFGRPQEDRFDPGFIIRKKKKQEAITDEERGDIDRLNSYIYNCGETFQVPRGEEMVLPEFLKLIVRDWLVYGHIAIEKIKQRNGDMHRFRSVPAESMFLVDERVDRKLIEDEIKQSIRLRNQELDHQDNNQETEKTVFFENIAYYKYVQASMEDSDLRFFGDEDMIFKLFNPQNHLDLRGYSQSPLEQAVLNITRHLNVDGYNANFFTNGYAARGILHLKGSVPQQGLTAFKRQFQNTINGTHNAWRTPIISGMEGVEWISLAPSSKDMEYLEYSDRLINSICSQFQINPVEIGMDRVSGGKQTGGQDGLESKINYSKERGLTTLINCDIIPAIDQGVYTDKYEFKIVGYTDETPQTVVAQAQAEMTVCSSMNDLLAKFGKAKLKHPIADIPLNQTFHNMAGQYMTKGELRELFLGKDGKDASKKPELQYLPTDPAFIQYAQFLFGANQAKVAQAQQEQAGQAQQEEQSAQSQQEQEQQQHEKELQLNQERRDQEAHEAEMQQAQSPTISPGSNE